LVTVITTSVTWPEFRAAGRIEMDDCRLAGLTTLDWVLELVAEK